MNRRRKFADELLWLNIVPASNDFPLEADEMPRTVVENLQIAVMLRGEVTSVRQLSLHLLSSSSSIFYFHLLPSPSSSIIFVFFVCVSVSFTKMTCEELPSFMITKQLSQLT